jgi:hypothetical protein
MANPSPVTANKANRKPTGWLLRQQPGFFAIVSTAYLVVLTLLLLARSFGWIGIDRLPNRIGGIIPLAIPWFGALGAVLISLYGVVDHNGAGRSTNEPWDPSYDYWHVLRPFIGAVLGTVSYLIFIGFVNATSSNGTNTPSPVPKTAEDAIPYLVIAFVVGFREDTFRQLIKRVIDTLLGPGIPGVTPAVAMTVTPLPIQLKGAADEDVPVDIHVSNAGVGYLVIHGTKDDPVGVSLSENPLVSAESPAHFRIKDDTVSGAVIPSTGEATMTVVFKAATPGTYEGTLTITSNAGTRTIPLSGTATPPPAPPATPGGGL